MLIVRCFNANLNFLKNFFYFILVQKYSELRAILGPYCAPHVDRSQGIESKPVAASSRYDRLVDDVESRLLKHSILPETMKTITRREFREAPLPAAGSASEAFADDADMMVCEFFIAFSKLMKVLVFFTVTKALVSRQVCLVV